MAGLINQLKENMHLDCGNCHSERVGTTGEYTIDDRGAYLEVLCIDCKKKSMVGDGEFWLVHTIEKVEN